MTRPGSRAPFTPRKNSIETSQKKLEAYPGIIFNFTQPAEDAVDEALTGLKSALAVKVYGPDLNTLQDKALQIKDALEKVPGFTELTVVRELGQPSLLDRRRIARRSPATASMSPTWKPWCKRRWAARRPRR